MAASALLLFGPRPVFGGSAEWLLAPGTGDWNSAGNWTPATVPNGAADVATFGLSGTVLVSLSANTAVNGIVFKPGASAFSITADTGFMLTLSGVGITNYSANVQHFIVGPNDTARINFTNSATADNAAFTLNGGTAAFMEGGLIAFGGSSTASNATFTVNGGQAVNADGADLEFNSGSTAGHGTFVNNGGAALGAEDGVTQFNDDATAGNSTIINNGSAFDSPDAGGRTEFNANSSAGAARLIANSGVGTGGGTILFFGDSTGGTARVELFGNGKLEISNHNLPGVTIGSLEGNGDVFLGANNLTVGSNNRSSVFSGVIQDGGLGGGIGGSLTKIGTGKLALTGNNTYSGGTTIDFGYLAVGSDHALGTGNVDVRLGILGTYNGPRPINVEGNYRQFGASVGGGYSGGMLMLGLGGTGLSQYDRLVVAGRASLAGELSIFSYNGFLPKVGDKFRVVSAAGGVSGRFMELEDPFKGNYAIKLSLTYRPASVILETKQDSFRPFAKTPNERAVAGALDSIAGDRRVGKLIGFLDTVPGPGLADLFDRIAPEELASIFNLGVALANVQTANLERRMGDLQAGAAGFSASGYAMSGSGPNSSGDANGDGGRSAYGVGGPAGKGGKELRAPSENRWGVFVTGVGEFTNIGDTPNARGYDLTTGGFTIGVDYRVTEHFALGLNTGYARSNADLSGGGRVTVDGAKLGLYATYFTGTGFYADAAVSGGYNSYDTRRRALLGTAVGSTHGGEFDALLSTGYDWKRGGLSIGPVASVQYTYVGMESFQEHGSLAPLRFNSKAGESLRTALGMRASYDIHAGGVIIRPEVRTAWQHEFDDSSFALDSRFANGVGKTFTVRGPEIGDDSLLIGAGVAVLWSERTSTYLYYDGEVARSNYSSNNVSGGVRISF